jgi:hypothetical protein
MCRIAMGYCKNGAGKYESYFRRECIEDKIWKIPETVKQIENSFRKDDTTDRQIQTIEPIEMINIWLCIYINARVVINRIKQENLK